ncbi:MAG: enoyl-CoA hydratase/isomerase family protein [Actinomycetota bacterium]
MADLVHLSQPADGVGLLLIDNPPKNFGSYELLDAMFEGVGAARRAGNRVLVIASDVPGYLMAHAYLPDVLDAYEHPDRVQYDPRLWRRLTDELEQGPMVTISCNHAQAWGGGAEISWACNLRTAGESATYAQIESILGVIPGGGGTVRFARLCGQSVAMELFLSGEPMTAPHLHRLGVVNRLYPDADLRSATIDWAARIATRPHRALLANKRGILQTWDLGVEAATRLENHLFNSTMRSETIEIMRHVQARYDQGADSWDAYDLPRPGEEAVS